VTIIDNTKSASGKLKIDCQFFYSQRSNKPQSLGDDVKGKLKYRCSYSYRVFFVISSGLRPEEINPMKF